MDRIDRAFTAIDRANFVPANQRPFAEDDTPLPIGYGQTISQPTTVRMMLEWLDAQSGQKVLDVGSGSGWTTALLSVLVGDKGHVYAVELVPQLVEFGEGNCERMGVTNASFFQAGQAYGLQDFAPYDRVLVSAAAERIPDELREQLAVGGKLIIPVRSDIMELTKISKDKWDTKTHPGFMFVPLL